MTSSRVGAMLLIRESVRSREWPTKELSGRDVPGASAPAAVTDCIAAPTGARAVRRIESGHHGSFPGIDCGGTSRVQKG